MPRPTIRKLALDVERVLFAGAHLAAADPELARDQAALRALAAQLGARAPVFALLCEKLGLALAASGPESASALMSVATTVAQVRAAQAELAPPPAEPRPLDPAPPIDTPCNARDLFDLHGALVETGPGRLEKVQQAVERGDIADLRLIEDLVEAIGETVFGELLVDRAAPLFGRALVGPLRARLHLKGRMADGRRLRALVAVEKAGARALLEAAVREGSAEVRFSALDAIGEHMPGVPDLEPLILGCLQSKERSGDVRRAAMAALAGYSSDAALAALLEGLGRDTTRASAVKALSSSTHPQIVDRLLTHLAGVLAVKPAPAPRPASVEVRLSVKLAHQERLDQACAVLQALTSHPTPAVASAAIDLLDELGAAAAWAVVESGDEKQLGAIAAHLVDDDDDLWPAAVAATWKLGEEQAYRRLAPAFTSKKTKPERLQILARSIPATVGERWIGLLIDLATGRDTHVAGVAAGVLGRLKVKRAVPALVKRLTKQKGGPPELIRALAEIGDSSAVAAIIEHALGGNEHQLGQAAYSAVLALADRTTVDKVRTKVTATAQPTWYMTNLLDRLERRFPGA